MLAFLEQMKWNKFCCYRSHPNSSLFAFFKEKLLIRFDILLGKLVELFPCFENLMLQLPMQNNLPGIIDIEMNSENYLDAFHLWNFFKLFNWMSSPEASSDGERMRLKVEHNEIVEISSTLELSELMTLIQIHLAIDIRFQPFEGDSCTYFYILFSHFVDQWAELSWAFNINNFNNLMLPYVLRNLIKIVHCNWYRILARYYV